MSLISLYFCNLGFFVNSLLISLALFFLIGFFYASIVLKYNKPMAILDENGIWIKDYGFIDWNNISAMKTFIAPMTPIEVIGINLKDIAIQYKQSTWQGKLNFFWAKLFNRHYHIVLSNLELENYKIINFAKQCIIKNNT